MPFPILITESRSLSHKSCMIVFDKVAFLTVVGLSQPFMHGLIELSGLSADELIDVLIPLSARVYIANFSF